ncbi:MAG: AzlD domain-containing protein [Devosia sp.]
MSEEAVKSLAGLGPYLTIVVAAALPTHIWRWLGVIFAGRLDEGSEFFIWVKAVATALVAAVIARLILFPVGPLEGLAVPARLAAAAAGFAAYIASGKSLGVGVVVAEVVLILSWFILV